MQVHFPTPEFSEQDAAGFAREFYGIAAEARPLPSERDRNFYLKSSSGAEFVLKFSNAQEDRSILELQHHVMKHLASAQISVQFQEIIPAKSGEEILTIERHGQRHYLRLFTFIPGTVLADSEPQNQSLLESLGEALGMMDQALQSFQDPEAIRELKWDLARAEWICSYTQHIGDSQRRAIVERFLIRHRELLPRIAEMRKGVIYNDANDYNVLVTRRDGEMRVSGMIDFGDLVHSYVVGDLAVGAAYAILHKPDPLTAATWVIAGYHRKFPLLESELELLFDLICMRLCITVTNAAFQRSAEPENRYLTISEEPAWKTLELLDRVDPRLAHFRFRHACAFPPSPQTQYLTKWLSINGFKMGKVLDIDVREQSVIDLSVGSPLPENPEHYPHGAVGRYGEARVLQNPEESWIAGNEGPQWRTVHLGLDLFAHTGTLVYAPFDATVHSFANNDSPGDYGPTIILQHQTEQDHAHFFTLYGHLSPDSIDHLHVGDRIRKGRVIGRVGSTKINGGWPPHLHFQIITDMMGYKGDFPGNSFPEQKDFWMRLCPDPNLIVKIPEEQLETEPPLSTEAIQKIRSHLIGGSLSISYRKPLNIRRGFMQYLFDETGRAFLDCVNNVAHVGHCHPRVVRAGQQQMAILNTNTRYLHDRIVEYAERLTATLPESLRVCFFVNSGSEANELAIRLARTHTKKKDLIVLESGYHGNTSTLIDISSYKFDGPGGSGPPSYVHRVTMPDPYRKKTARDSVQQIQKAASQSAAFLCETMPGCGGQIIFPAGYLRDAYAKARANGAVCIADEVQTGFGRPGTHFWAFETQGVVPDIVTMGKPIANGHPLGAVVTTREIAESFCTGMEYFNTFGGNPVSCAIGLEVLNVIRDEHLQEHAFAVGNHLFTGFRNLMDRHKWIGDVRGSGLYLGIELVKDRDTQEPAAKEADFVINRMRDHAILLSTDGPFHNVIKIKPPMIFTQKNADFLIATLDQVLSEIPSM